MKTPDALLRRVALALSLVYLSLPCLSAHAAGNKSDCQKEARHEAAVSTEQRPNGHKWVKAKILINASPHVVWETIHEERKKDPDMAYSKILSQESETQATLEQKFCLIPVIGTSTCVMRNIEVPLERIDYNMIRSDRFKALEGSWVLSPGTQPNETYLELSSFVDMGLPIPRGMVDGVTAKKLQRRLANVKTMAEAEQTRLARK